MSSSSSKRKQPPGESVGEGGKSGKKKKKEEEEEASESSSSSSEDDSESSSGESESEEEQAGGGTVGRTSGRAGGRRGGNMDMEKLYTDDNDRERLNQMSEFDREKILHQRYVDRLRKQQRDELFQRSESGRKKMEKEQQKKQAVFLDIRAKRHRQRQKLDEEDEEEEDSDESGSGSKKGGRRSRPSAQSSTGKDGSGSSGSSSSSSSGEESDSEEDSAADEAGSATADKPAVAAGQAAPRPATQRTKASAGGRGVEGEALVVAGGAGREFADGLFADGEVDEDGQRNQRKRQKLLECIDLPLLQSVLLNVGRILHMLEHPKADGYLCGCFVLYRVTDGVAICSIVGVKSSEQPYTVEGKVCRHQLILRPGTMHSLDTTARLTQLNNAPLTTQTLEMWRNSLSREKSNVSIDDWPRKMKTKAQQLKAFTYTEDDVQRILDKNKHGGVSRGGSIVKQKQIILHEIQALRQNTANRLANRPKVEELELRYKALEAMETQKNQQTGGAVGSGSAARWTATQLSPQAGGGRGRGHRGMLLLGDRVGGGGRCSGGGGLMGGEGGLRQDTGGVGGGKEPKTSGANPFARRECRPTMMWDTKSKGSAMATAAAAAAAAGGKGEVEDLEKEVVEWKKEELEECKDESESDDEFIRDRAALSQSHDKQQDYLKNIIQLYREIDLVTKLQLHIPGISAAGVGPDKSGGML
eukprot:GHVS01061425.1.p1 GENE.GHVS01061425.1~~GHVS01061425.1.p1  ORF type:complete len:700 (+),score=204.64 GHVS01061425.1:189-2288(+)